VVRLGGCILLELAVGATLLAGVGVGVYVGGRRLADVSEAHASQPGSDGGPVATRSALGLVPLASAEAPSWSATRSLYFEGIKDESLLAPLRTAKLVRAKFNRGGTSISLRLDFEGGYRAAFKPEQEINIQTVPRKEIAAYRVSRLLGITAVAPAIGRSFTAQELLEVLDTGAGLDLLPRFMAEVSADAEGRINGELQWWIPTIVDVKIDGETLDTEKSIKTWRQWLQVGTEIPEEQQALLTQMADMIVFDYLINNVDRWSGSNTKGSPDGKLYFMDNAYSFGNVRDGHDRNYLFLNRTQKVSRRLIEAVRSLDEATLRRAVLNDSAPYDRLLGEKEIRGVMHRRQKLLEYVDELVALFGEEQVLVFP
jgi:hypothetical protein